MATKITILLDAPGDTDAFEAQYKSVRRAAGALPALSRLETSKVWPKEDGTGIFSDVEEI